jgi:hypothetical protein
MRFADMITIDQLAQEIRRVDGNHSLGAGALAEKLMPFIEAALAAAPAGAVKPGDIVRWIEWAGGDFLPVPPEMQVMVLLRDGSTEGPAKALEFAGENSCWKHRGTSGDIVAYTSDLLFASPVAQATDVPRVKRWAKDLTDDELTAEQAEVEAKIANGFGEHGGSPGEWFYERADEIAAELRRRAAPTPKAEGEQ